MLHSLLKNGLLKRMTKILVTGVMLMGLLITRQAAEPLRVLFRYSGVERGGRSDGVLRDRQYHYRRRSKDRYFLLQTC